jgi:hypothetical protein
MNVTDRAAVKGNYLEIPFGMRKTILSHQRILVLLLALILLAAGTPLLAQLPTNASQSALNSVNADLQEEIIAGSSNNTFYATPFYAPWSNQNMLPQLVGSTGTGGMENLLKVSIPQPFYSGTSYITAGSTRASPALTTGTSLNGRTFTAALWNLPLLMPVTSGSDYTPLVTTGSFTPPNWILVAKDGSNPNTWSTNLLSSANNSSTVVGRYAYTIYHEGGLLDANVAGYPSTSTPTQVGYKTGLPYADLTQIGLTQPQVDSLVGWRNFASTQAPGTPTNPAFTPASGSNYYQYILSNTTGFLTANTTTYNGQTDQQFTSRQQLINFSQNTLGLTGTNLDTLNYLATFTRGVNQPSFAPKSGRPLILSGGANNGGNNAQGQDDYSEVSNPINPNFLQVQVSGTFLRNDGSIAVVGEPLVNKRFPLNRLAWLTYLGPSAYRNIPTTNPGVNSQDYDMWQLVNVYGISPTYLAQGTNANIENYFGLVWQQDSTANVGGRSGTAASFHDNEYKWFYTGHCESNGSIIGATGSISRLIDIANQGTGARDADFFELLKAAVVAGSKAKSIVDYANALTYSKNLGGAFNPWCYNWKLDTSLDLAILQLGANIIDQFKVDGYATRIIFNDGNSADYPQEVRGAENLPYLYRMQSGVLKLRSESVTGGTGHETDSPPAAIQDAGVAMVMHIPVVWNPYDSNASMGTPAAAGPAGPSNATSPNIRIIADSTAPDLTDLSGSTTGYNFFGCLAVCEQPTVSGSQINAPQLVSNQHVYTTGPNGAGTSIPGGVGSYPGSNWAQAPAASGGQAGYYALTAMTPLNSQLIFSDSNTGLFREPTVLAMEGLPHGSNLQMAAPVHIFDYNKIQNNSGATAWISGTNNTGGFLCASPNPLDIPGGVGTSQPYVGFCAGLLPVMWAGPAQSTGTAGVYESLIALLVTPPGSNGDFVTYRVQYQDPNPADPPNSWITYDQKYFFLDTLFLGVPIGTKSGNLSDQDDGAQGGDWSTYVDPRTSRFSSLYGRDLTSPMQTPGGSGELGEWADPANGVEKSDRPDNNSGYSLSVNRGYTEGSPFYELQIMEAFGWSLTDSSFASNSSQGEGGHFRMGMLSQNSSTITDNGIRFSGDASPVSPEGPMYYADPDFVVRGAMGNYQLGNNSAPALDTVGLPMATAYPANYLPTTTGTYQGQSRPYFLHRPFQSVAELGYVFSGTPWKNLDLFTPQSGDCPLLDVFTINETPPESANPNDLVAGTVNLNTHQGPVLQALLSGAYVDEVTASQGTTSTAVPPISGAEANAIATSNNGLIARTTGTLAAQGPLENVSELVGAWNLTLDNYTGPSGDLTNIYASAFSGSTLEMMQNIQRFRESFIRPLAAAGNTRLWNLMIDLVVQNGQYPATATGFDNFLVNCEQRYWVHESIDRFTGQIVAQSVETVGPSSLLLSGSSVFDNLAAGANVATLNSSELSGTGPYTYTLVSGSGANNNSNFTIVGNQLETNGVFDYLNQSTYTVLVGVTDTNGLTYVQPVTINVQPGPYSQWKLTYFGSDAGNDAVAGDQVDSQNDGIPNLLKYALGISPLTPATTGITVKNTGHTLAMTYPKADAATDVTVSVVAGSDLSNPNSWTASGVTQTMLSDNGATQQWQASTPVTAGKQLFMHLTVTRP